MPLGFTPERWATFVLVLVLDLAVQQASFSIRDAATWTDSAGRTLRSIDQLDKVTAVTYDPVGNQLTVRDPINIGADMVYDSLCRNTQLPK